jgi:hypothetical protein
MASIRLSALCLLMMLLYSFTASSQATLVYDVVKGKKIIGTLISSKIIRDNLTEYAIESKVNVDMILAFKIYSRVSGVYRDGVLIDGKILRKVNDSEKANAHIFWATDKYFIQEDKKLEEFRQKIFYSTACLMHWEPVNFSAVYSENYKKMIPVKVVGPHKYMLLLPDGNKNYYTYQNGICLEAEVNTNLSTAYFRLRK